MAVIEVLEAAYAEAKIKPMLSFDREAVFLSLLVKRFKRSLQV
jgi:hypothetical protein